MSKHLSTSVRVPIEADNPSIVRNESLCIKCGQCRNVCTSPVGVLGTYALEQTGDRAICKPYPLSRTFSKEREKQRPLLESLLLIFY